MEKTLKLIYCIQVWTYLDSANVLKWNSILYQLYSMLDIPFIDIAYFKFVLLV